MSPNTVPFVSALLHSIDPLCRSLALQATFWSESGPLCLGIVSQRTFWPESGPLCLSIVSQRTFWSGSGPPCPSIVSQRTFWSESEPCDRYLTLTSLFSTCITRDILVAERTLSKLSHTNLSVLDLYHWGHFRQRANLVKGIPQ